MTIVDNTYLILYKLQSNSQQKIKQNSTNETNLLQQMFDQLHKIGQARGLRGLKNDNSLKKQ